MSYLTDNFDPLLTMPYLADNFDPHLTMSYLADDFDPLLTMPYWFHWDTRTVIREVVINYDHHIELHIIIRSVICKV